MFSEMSKQVFSPQNLLNCPENIQMVITLGVLGIRYMFSIRYAKHMLGICLA